MDSQECAGRGNVVVQLCSLTFTLVSTVALSLLRSIYLAPRLVFNFFCCHKAPTSSSAENLLDNRAAQDHHVQMYEGKVWHERKKPLVHKFEYPVRYALINLDKPPSWFSALHHISASEARHIASTSGAVHLLTVPTSVGYEQNPLSVYYCYSEQGQLLQCIAEVTNTPWAERATFLFNPGMDQVAKSLYVSPFMDMKGVWVMQATSPGQELLLQISVQHPDYGLYFRAILKAKRVDGVHDPELFTWLMPHKVAFWIYWQALLLICKGVSFVPHPKYTDENKYRERVQNDDTHLYFAPLSSGSGLDVVSNGSTEGKIRDRRQRPCTWRDAASYPWK
ncbi:unnamed protein product [Sphagnum troendelagicum]|uniref:DUF1365 domain-containing protein n=1 Tax=Sphagnum troendelagicum TaxID=128251 RepID=A0ABP0TML9_9BRYO